MTRYSLVIVLAATTLGIAAPFHRVIGQQPSWCRKDQVGVDTIVLTGTARNVSCIIAADWVRADSFTCVGCTIRFRNSAKPKDGAQILLVGGHVLDLALSDGDKITSLELDGVTADTVTLSNMRIGLLRLTGGRVSSLRTNNAVIDTLRINGVDIGSMTFEDGAATIIALDNLKTGKIRFKGGVWRGLVLHSEEGNLFKVQFDDARLVNPFFDPELVGNLDFSQAGPDGVNFRVWQDEQAREELTGRGTNATRRRKLFDAQIIYGGLSRQLREAGAYDGSRQMELRQKEAEIEALEGYWSRRLSRTWHVHLRGEFGLAPSHILWVGVWVWAVFAGFYLLLGMLGLAWAAMVPLDLMGKTRGDPKFLRLRTPGDLWGHAKNALAFSADRLFFGGTRFFLIDQIFDNLTPEPVKFVGVGLGRFFGSIEGVLGLLLLANWIQAIAKTN